MRSGDVDATWALWDDGLTPDERRAWARRLREDPALRIRVQEDLLVVGLLHAQGPCEGPDLAARVRYLHAMAGADGERVRRATRHRPILRLPRRRALVVAAALLAVVGGLVVCWPRSGSERPAARIDGARCLQLDDGSVLDFGDGALAAVVADRGGTSVALDRGTVVCRVTPRDADRPFRVTTEDSEVRVLGTRFSVHAECPGTYVLVDAGLVEVRAGERTTRLGRAESCWVGPDGAIRGQIALDGLDLGAGPAAWLRHAPSGAVVTHRIAREDPDRPGHPALIVEYDLSRCRGARPYVALTHKFAGLVDIRDRHGIRVRWRGSGTGMTLCLSFKEIGPNGLEHFSYRSIDESPAWRDLTLAWRDFERRPEYQSPHPARDGFDQLHICSLTLSVLQEDAAASPIGSFACAGVTFVGDDPAGVALPPSTLEP